MVKRKKINQKGAKKLFTKTASVKQVRPINLIPMITRGGYRM